MPFSWPYGSFRSLMGAKCGSTALRRPTSPSRRSLLPLSRLPSLLLEVSSACPHTPPSLPSTPCLLPSENREWLCHFSPPSIWFFSMHAHCHHVTDPHDTVPGPPQRFLSAGGGAGPPWSPPGSAAGNRGLISPRSDVGCTHLFIHTVSAHHANWHCQATNNARAHRLNGLTSPWTKRLASNPNLWAHAGLLGPTTFSAA